jgi:hypothetical protein
MTTGLAQFRIIIQEGDRISVRYRPPRREGDELEYASRPLSIDATRRRTIEMQVRLLRNNQLRERRDLECLGENLFAALFYTSDGQGYNDFGRALRDAIRETERGDDGQDDTILRVALQFDDPNSAYARWPWEYMFCPLRERESFGDFFLAHRTKVVLTRFLALTDVEPNLEQPPLRVLLVAPSPTAAEGELLPVESTAVREDLEALGGRGTPATDGSDGGRRRIELRVLPEGDEGVVLFDDFKAALAEFNPHVVHFLGHGEYRDSGGETKGHLAFTRSDGSIDWIEDRVFAEAVGDQKSLRLVFLQACESAETGPSSWYQVVAGTAQRVSQKNIPAVVALHYRVENRIGNAMARAFHAELAQRHSVEAALTAARRVAMSSRHDPGLFTSFGLPVLYLRGVGDVLDPNERPTLSTPPPVRPVEQQRTAKCPFDGAPYNPEEQNFCGRCLQRVVCGKCLRPRTDTESPICLNCGAPWPAAEQRQENAFQAASQPLVSLGGSSGGLPKQKDMHLP